MSILDLINAARAVRSVPPLRPNSLIGAAALGHAQDMAAHVGLVHIGSDGSDGGERMRRAGYQWQQWGEVVGWGWEGDAARMLDYWLNSPVHYAAIHNPDVSEMGWSYVYRPGSQWGHYWVVDFGRRVKSPSEPPNLPPDAPYTSHVPVVLSGGKPVAGLDLLPYLRGDGRAYRVGNARGSFEVFQSQTDGDTFYQVKAWDDLSRVNWESFTVTPDYIGRDVDTSPGGGRFYRQFGAPWVKRFMTMGESFTQRKRVQFYNLADCSESAANSGDVTDTITLQEHLDTWRSPWGIVVPDVVVLRWEEGGELYRFGRGYGLVGWSREHSDPNSPAWSAIYAMRPALESLRRLPVGCL